jgi:hypothetical protein
VPPAWEYLRLQRAEITLDSALALLLPKADYIKLAQSYMKASQRRSLARAGTKRARRQLLNSLGSLVSMPQRLGENIQFNAEWLRKRAMTFAGSLTMAAAVGKLVLSFLIQVTIVCVLVLWAGHHYPRLRNQSPALDWVFRGEHAAKIVALEPGVRLLLVLVLLAAVVLFARIRTRVARRRGHNPAIHAR